MFGDKIVSVNGESVPKGREVAPEGRKALRRFSKFLAKVLESGQPIDVEVLRDGQPAMLQVQPALGPDVTVHLVSRDEVNAYADGHNVFITKGMVRFVEDDTELSLVIAHEIAHNCMMHIEAKTKNTLWGTLFDIAAAAYGVDTGGAFGQMAGGTFSQEFEAEADYVGLYVMARAGGDIENAPYFWRRMAAEHPGSIRQSHSASHPATPERFAALDVAVTEIQTKQKAGAVLLPEVK